MYARAAKPRRHTGVAIIFWCILIIAVGFTLWHLTQSSATFHYSSLFASQVQPIPTPDPAFVPLDIEQRWRQVMAKYPTTTVAIELRDVDSNLIAGINQTAPHRAASTTKLIAASLFLTQVEQGQQSLNQSLGGQSAQWQLQQLINQSNNDSWETFLDLLGPPQQASFAQQLGLTSYNISTNYIDVDDLASLLQKLWRGQLLNNQHTQYLLSLMQNTNDDTLIPPAIPADATIYHKYGELEDDVNDAAIIKTGGHVYALVIMTNGNGIWAYDTRTQLFHDLVAATFAPN